MPNDARSHPAPPGAAAPSLLIRLETPGDTGPERTVEMHGASVVLGRSRAAQIHLPGQDVSAAHAKIAWTDSGLVVQDLGSANGTWLDRQTLAPGRPYPLAWGQPIHIANHVITVLEPDASATPSQHEPGLGPTTATLAAHLLEDLAGSRDAALLRVTHPPDEERLVQLKPGDRVRFGRDPRCDVRLLDPDLSRIHAEILMSAEGALLKDLGSKNGVTVNGVGWSSGHLTSGDVVRMGGCEIWYEDRAQTLLANLAPEQPQCGPEEENRELPLAAEPANAGAAQVEARESSEALHPAETDSEGGAESEERTPAGRRQKTRSSRWASLPIRAALLGLGLTLIGAAVYLLLLLFA